MKQTLKRLAAVMGIVWLLWVSALLYWMIAPKILGPEKSVRALHASIHPGMTAAAFEARINQDQNLQVMSLIPDGEQYVSKTIGSWLCTFSVQLQNEKVNAIKGVICVD